MSRRPRRDERGSVTVLAAGVLLAAGPLLLSAVGVGEIELARARAAALAEAAAAALSCSQAAAVARLGHARLLACNESATGPGRVRVAVALPGWLARQSLGPVVAAAPRLPADRVEPGNGA